MRDNQRGNPTQTQMSNKSSAHNVEVNFFRWRRDDGLFCSGCCRDLALRDLALVDDFLDPVGHLLHHAFPALPALPPLDGGDVGQSSSAGDTLFHRNGFPGNIICNCRVRNVQSCMNVRVEAIGLRMRCNVMCFESCCLQCELSVSSSAPSTLPVPSLRTSDLP